MLIEVQKLNLPEGKNLFDLDTYPLPGIYLVDDGKMNHAVIVSKFVQSTPVSDIFIKEVENHDSEIEFLKKEISSKEQEIDMIRLSRGITGDVLLKAIAIAQKPELSTELIK